MNLISKVAFATIFTAGLVGQTMVFVVYLVFVFFLTFFGSEGPGSGFLWFYNGFLPISVKIGVLLWFSLVLRLAWLNRLAGWSATSNLLAISFTSF